MNKKSVLNVMARTGYAARAVVYALTGSFALLVMFGFKGSFTDSEGSLRNLPFGTTFLVALAIGLLAYAVWRLQATLAEAKATWPTSCWCNLSDNYLLEFLR